MSDEDDRPRCGGSGELVESLDRRDRRDPDHQTREHACPGCPDCQALVWVHRVGSDWHWSVSSAEARSFGVAASEEAAWECARAAREQLPGKGHGERDNVPHLPVTAPHPPNEPLSRGGAEYVSIDPRPIGSQPRSLTRMQAATDPCATADRIFALEAEVERLRSELAVAVADLRVGAVWIPNDARRAQMLAAVDRGAAALQRDEP